MKLSIITVNLNNARGLEKTAESIIKQTYSDFEWLVIDGGSADGSIEIIKKHSDRISFWVSEPDSGIYNAMNKGIRKANCEYCLFLNSGDYFADANALHNLFSCNFSEDVVSGNMHVTKNGKILEKCTGRSNITFLDLYRGLVKHQATIIRRDLFERYGLYDENLKIVADYEFFLRTIGLGKASYRYIDTDLTCFDSCGISNHNSSLVSQEKELVHERHIPARMRPDYDLLIKYRNIRFAERIRLFGYSIRISGKIARLLSKRNLSG